MHDLRCFFSRQLWRYLVCGALGGLVPLQVSALDNMPKALDQFNTWSNGNVVSSRYAHQAAAGAIKHAQSSAVAGMAAVDGVLLNKPIAINTKNGLVTAVATQKIGARQIALALRGALGGPLGLALLAAPAVLALVGDAGLRLEDGQFEQADPESCTSNCFTYSTSVAGTAITSPSLSGFCAAYIGVANGLPPPYYLHEMLGIDAANHRCQMRRLFINASGQGVGNWETIWVAGSRTSRAPDSDAWVPATQQEVEDKLTAANPSPEVLRDLVQIGDVVPAPAPADQTSITNPQPSPEKTTTKTNPDGSTEETKCQTLGILQGIDIRMVEECTTTMKDPLGNTTSTSTTTSDDADPKPEQEEKSTFCELFPGTLACAELGTPTGDDIPRSERSVAFEAEVLFGSGTCPADTSILVRGVTVPVGQWSKWCPYITDYARPMVILLAGFAALMIVARGMPE